jgi:hypothetical protein
MSVTNVARWVTAYRDLEAKSMAPVEEGDPRRALIEELTGRSVYGLNPAELGAIFWHESVERPALPFAPPAWSVAHDITSDEAGEIAVTFRGREWSSGDTIERAMARIVQSIVIHTERYRDDDVTWEAGDVEVREQPLIDVGDFTELLTLDLAAHLAIALTDAAGQLNCILGFHTERCAGVGHGQQV